MKPILLLALLTIPAVVQAQEVSRDDVAALEAEATVARGERGAQGDKVQGLAGRVQAHEAEIAALDHRADQHDEALSAATQQIDANRLEIEEANRAIRLLAADVPSYAEELGQVERCVPLFEESAAILSDVAKALEGGASADDVAFLMPDHSPAAEAASCVLDLTDGLSADALGRGGPDLLAMVASATSAEAWMVALRDGSALAGPDGDAVAGLSRIKFRELALAGRIPGVRKASW